MKEYPKISVVTPSYNQGAYIEQTIRSVLDQSYPNLEYIIIDGGSTDQSVEIIQRYADRLTFWVSEKDSGQTDALNKGMLRTTGDILCYLNSDDVFLPGALIAVAKAVADGGDWWSGDCIHFGGESAYVLSPSMYRNWVERMRCCGINQPATFWSRKVYETVGLFNEKMHYAFDYEYWLRMYVAGFRLIKVNQPLAAFRHHQEGKTATPAKFFEEQEEMYVRILPQLKSCSRISARLGLRLRAIGIEMGKSGLLKLALKYPDALLLKGFYRRLITR